MPPPPGRFDIPKDANTKKATDQAQETTKSTAAKREEIHANCCICRVFFFFSEKAQQREMALCKVQRSSTSEWLPMQKKRSSQKLRSLVQVDISDLFLFNNFKVQNGAAASIYSPIFVRLTPLTITPYFVCYCTITIKALTSINLNWSNKGPANKEEALARVAVAWFALHPLSPSPLPSSSSLSIPQDTNTAAGLQRWQIKPRYGTIGHGWQEGFSLQQGNITHSQKCGFKPARRQWDLQQMGSYFNSTFRQL